MIWIDIDNAPHVVLFRPIIKKLREDGYKVVVTARDYGNTLGLLKLHNIDYVELGVYGGKSKIKKILNLLHRTYQLISFKKKNSLDVKLSINHGSRTHCIASKLMGIKTISMGDYEHAELEIISTFTDYFLTPKLIDKNVMQKKFNKKQLIYYPGIKENIYLFDYQEKVLDFIPNNKVIVILRPPSFTSNYAVKKSEDLFDAIMKKILATNDIFTVCLPRTKEQGRYIKNKYTLHKDFMIPKEALNGADLLNMADVVISGGGTMNREATIFGCKVYSIFGGTAPSIDKMLEKENKLEFISDISEINKLQFIKKEVSEQDNNSDTFEFVYNKIIKEYE